MGLFLVETTIDESLQTKEAFEKAVEHLKTTLNEGELIEVQVAADFHRAFFIIEANEQPALDQSLKEKSLKPLLTKEIRIVGQELEDVKKQREKINYLVEWNLPKDLTMDQYLARKKANSVHYAEVPEVKFSRTYVCEDMSKCLCFYDAPDDEAVKRARKVVKAPIDAITRISE
ncbi:DUF4242 domain-containing protein [Shouchella clausii]|uniref:DUF4242 domain-containing protein n=1 Tax=Shouchella clausii TaxID=79880 RepID=UPI00079AFB17|nr:DUF4242 domain-containing protein [Shouchella clausii]AST95756.1 hypothetical protein BC8716_07260 [Shouchella clausii]KKI86665.1 alpha-helical coiled-coil protein [Shouchella clausii]MCR1288977.1 DUF4242 domain-containing protein [Shouchella clausii]MEB5472162.1 DUF4242 domain-containing protein [Shouchella clausii]MED4160028.1 DUF4242 domain-containing protein [Shouchella clausii]